MTHSLFTTDTETHGQSPCRARVIQLHADGRVSVQSGDDATQFLCEVLVTSERHRLVLTPGDLVLVWPTMSSAETRVILGRIGATRTEPSETGTASETQDDDTPDELLIEAKHSLTLRVGAGSITIREDGRILIKGKDLVSHAQRLNRIRGGAVQIN